MSSGWSAVFHSGTGRVWFRWVYVLAAVLSLGVLSTARADEPAAGKTTDVFVYENPDEGTNGLPRFVPVVVSFKGTQPSVAFQLGCGSNNSRLLEGFGYSRDFNLEFVRHFGSLELLQSELKESTGQGPDVPFRLLRCPADPEVMRQQIVQVYRLIDGDPKKAPASPYLLRLRDDPGNIYMLGCLNPLTALSWSRDGGKDLEQVSVPITQAVYDSWVGKQGVQPREIHCHPRTARPLPPVSGKLSVQPAEGDPDGPTQLFKLDHRLEGIDSPKALYLLSGGKGYALDCGSLQDEMKAAFGFDPAGPLEELTTTDPRYAASQPNQQPILRCASKGLTVFESVNEQPNVRYYRFGDSQSLLRFACLETSAFFSSNAPEAQKVPREALPYLLVAEHAPNEPTPILNVGCAGLSATEQNQLRAWFHDVFGQKPTTEEGEQLKRLYKDSKPKATQDPGSLARLVKAELSKQLQADAGRFRAVVERGIRDGKVANHARPNLDEGAPTVEDIDFFLQDLRKGGVAALETGIYKWVEDRVEHSRAVPRLELLRSFDAVFGCDKARDQFGKCPAPEGLSFWTGAFYGPRNQNKDFSSEKLIQDHESYLKACARPKSTCQFELENILARACTTLGKPCGEDAQRQREVSDWITRGWLCPNYKSIECYVRTDRNLKSDRWGCHYPTIEGGTCP